MLFKNKSSNQVDETEGERDITSDLTGLDDYQAHAAELYRDLYGRTPNVEYRQRIEELTGEPPPDPPPLPPLPQIMAQKTVDLAALLERVETMIPRTSTD